VELKLPLVEARVLQGRINQLIAPAPRTGCALHALPIHTALTGFLTLDVQLLAQREITRQFLAQALQTGNAQRARLGRTALLEFVPLAMQIQILQVVQALSRRARATLDTTALVRV
jgi:hypothetical protein